MGTRDIEMDCFLHCVKGVHVDLRCCKADNIQPRSQGLFPGLRAGREKTLASAGQVSILHPEILGVIN